jgi:hypothetical protein
MGISLPALRHLISLTKINAIQGEILLLGRMSPMFTTKQLKNTLKNSGLNSDFKFSQSDYSNIYRHNPQDFEIFESLGFSKVYSLDASSYENVDFVHDLNLPLPSNFSKKFDFIYDGGTLEHIFNLPQVLCNLHLLLRDGGYIFHESPANNFVDHGFYQISPTLYFDYYTTNKYEVVNSMICQVYKKKNKKYKVFEYLPLKFETFSYGGWKNALLCSIFVVRKNINSTSGHIPQQSRYQELFWKDDMQFGSPDFSNWRYRWGHRFPKLRYWYVRFRRLIIDTFYITLPKRKPKPDSWL